ncbi:MAG: hypothetical protein QOJ46_874 [bacterium]|jgi:CheY-like chemotaxis protein
MRTPASSTTVAGTAAALDAARSEPPDLVLLDLVLPDGDGRDVCRTLRSESGVPVIMLTARGTETDRVVGLELGATTSWSSRSPPWAYALVLASSQRERRRATTELRAAAGQSTMPARSTLR